MGDAANNQIELMDYGKETAEHHYGNMIQVFHRFLVDSMSSEGNNFPHNPWLFLQPPADNDPAAAPITQLLGVDAKSVITCLECNSIRSKDQMTHIIDMAYPAKKVRGHLRASKFALTECA